MDLAQPGKKSLLLGGEQSSLGIDPDFSDDGPGPEGTPAGCHDPPVPDILGGERPPLLRDKFLTKRQAAMPAHPGAFFRYRDIGCVTARRFFRGKQLWEVQLLELFHVKSLRGNFLWIYQGVY